MPNQIPENIKAERLAKLDTYLNETQREFNISCINKTLSCLLEGPDKTGKHLIYRTPYMQPCIVEYRDNAPETTNIIITDANKACLHGKITD
jgi:tRNA-2-methylthio-N6-dimethylallyladenosine synthase